MVFLKGVNWVHNDIIGSNGLEGGLGDKIRPNGLERSHWVH